MKRPVPTVLVNALTSALLLTLLLVACAPAAGSTSLTPVVAKAGEAKVSEGGVTYVQVDHSLDDFDLTPKDLRTDMWIPSGVNSNTARVTPDFVLKEVDVPTGWTFDVAVVQVERKFTPDSPRTDDGVTTYSLAVVYRVEVPERAIPGTYRVRGTLSSRKDSVPVMLRLEVVTGELD